MRAAARDVCKNGGACRALAWASGFTNKETSSLHWPPVSIPSTTSGQRRLPMTLSLLCCQRLVTCFRVAIGVQLLYSKLHTKFFVKLVYKRLRPTLERHQTKDQVGFRPCTSVEDALVVLESVCNKSLEWN